jgi:hypothetical protein
MALQFRRAIKHMEIWSASSDGSSFVISCESRVFGCSGAIKIGGSPFEMLAEAEEACMPS